MALSDLVESRLKNLEGLRGGGIEPYPYTFQRSMSAAQAVEKFSGIKAGENTGKKVSVCGRVMARRSVGGIDFIDVEDATGKLQAVARQDLASKESLKILEFLDIGDYIGVTGEIFKTKRGELSVQARGLVFLSKAIRPLPDKWHGLKDIEARYRHRALDLIMNSETRSLFAKRSEIIDFFRRFLKEREFLEVETPLLQPVYGGANAKPFITHANAWDTDFYLSISPELYLKRLIVGGYEKVFTICKNFRNEDADRTHNPEFTMMELYQAYADYNDIMGITEELIEKLAKEITGNTTIDYQGTKIKLKAPWERIPMLKAIKKFGNIDVEKMSEAEMLKQIESSGEKYEGPKKWGWLVNEMFERFAQDKIIQPTFIIDHPKETTPLCKQHRKDPRLIERVEPIINRWEVGNAYSELNDPILQKKLFDEQEKETKLEDKHPKDIDFVETLEYGMPPTGGLGIGIDRIVILLTGQQGIKDVIFFPQMRPEKQ